MRITAACLALFLGAAIAHADSGVLLPGQDIRFGNVHVANLEGANGNVAFFDNGTQLLLVVADEAYCAVLRNGTDRQDRRIQSLVLGGGYYAQANINGAAMTVLGDHAVALSLALRPRHTNNANTIQLWGNGNLAAAVRWCHGEGEVLMNKITFGLNRSVTGSRNDAYLSGDREGTFDLAWANRSVDLSGNGNETIAFDGFPCPEPPAIDVRPVDVARDAGDLAKDRTAEGDAGEKSLAVR